jgi:hypothetical protein
MQIYGSQKAAFGEGIDLRGMENAFFVEKTGAGWVQISKKMSTFARQNKTFYENSDNL